MLLPSDGAGLCGEYIASSNLMDMIDTEREVDVYYTVMHMKKARPEFVATAVRYMYTI